MTIPKRKPPELLAPAGSFAALCAAVKGGADSVYFGGRIANARNSATNFNDEEISRAINLLHDHGRYAYITLNTLHTDRELESSGALLKFAEHCYISGADAFIIQDIGLSRIIRKYFPEIKLHASTQMAGHNLCSAKKFSELGFSRVVISRESDRGNLKYLINHSPIEIEMFIHGALCSSHSGRCFMSFALGNTRSANRGMCAQPCRLKYDGKYNNGYALSLKDLCLAGYMKDIIELSPAGLKIEGRMKPPEYVYNVCKIYRTCLDENRNATNQEVNFLAKIFSRQGFTDGYYMRNLGLHMYGVRTGENKMESKKYSESQNIFRVNTNGSTSSTGSADTARRVPAIQSIPQISKTKNIKINPKLFLVFNSAGQFEQVADFLKTETDEILKRIYKIFVSPENQKNQKEFKIPQELAKMIGVKLPYVIFDSEREQIVSAVKNTGLNSVLIDNIGHIDIASEFNLEMSGNFGLNAANSYSLDEYKKMGFENIILSPELNFAQIRDINKPVNCGIIAYGRTNVMISENCLIKNSATKHPPPAGGTLFTKEGGAVCAICEDNNKNFYLTDRTGAKFLVQGNFGHRNIVCNSVPVYLADKKDLYKNLGLFFVSLNFTDENPGQIKKIISDYVYKNDHIKPPEKFTRGYK